MGSEMCIRDRRTPVVKIASLKLFNLLISVECQPGLYGIECKDNCSKHCLDPMNCDHMTGQCVDGCANGWIGQKCIESKKGEK